MNHRAFRRLAEQSTDQSADERTCYSKDPSHQQSKMLGARHDKSDNEPDDDPDDHEDAFWEAERGC